MSQLRTMLLNQYIGAIAIGLLVARCFETFVGAFMPAFNAILTQFLTGTSMGKDYWKGTVRGSMISNIVLTAIFLLIAYLLSSWLYTKPEEEVGTSANTE
jgi:glycerol uptake facilitator-like aquaporin